ncbi:hypothetical protein M407DRAFT_24519 [Tulasnella calospora MUT 4182]|uniref:Uncharacterized protein n=1 Tax=Tulasnella calospora MUT 4182 TaxID=1051891 RepID=A0A0C3Q8M0_9AGAM|nr:hypothetical protein M407DRAFT_24519 [Tulasnella calospora MUT 4182]
MAMETGQSSRYTWPTGKVWDLITCVGRPENRIVLLGKEKDENTSGDTKVKVQQRIASELFPDEFEGPTLPAGEKKKRQKGLGTRVKGEWEHLVKGYRQQVRKMMVTGNGVNLNVDDANLGEVVLAGAGGLFVGAGGPDEATPEPAKNLWDQINQEFQYFGELHRLISSRPNVIPISITTLGPAGTQTVYPQPPSSTATTTGQPPSIPTPSVTQSTFVSDVRPPPSGYLPNSQASDRDPSPPNGLEATNNSSPPPPGPATPLPVPAPKPSSNRKKALKPQPPQPSTLSKKLVSHVGKSSGPKRGWEEALISFQEHSLHASLAVEKAKAQNEAKQIALQELQLGIISKEEYRAQFGLDRPLAKKRRTDPSSVRVRSSPTPSADPGPEGNEQQDGGEGSELDFPYPPSRGDEEDEELEDDILFSSLAA